MSDILEQFKSLDTDSSGYLCVEEFTSIIRGHTNMLTDDIVDLLFSIFDQNGDGKINYDEYLSMTSEAKLETRIQINETIDIEEEMSMLSTFWSLSDTETNTMTTNAVAEWIHSLNIPATTQRILLAMADEDDDGQIDFNEFQTAYRRVMTHVHLNKQQP